MDESLRLMLNQLTTAHNDPALQNELDDNLSALRVQITVTQFLAKVHAMELSADKFVTLVYSVLKSASVEWLVPELVRENQDGAPATSLSDATNDTCERLYADLSAAVCKHACVRSLVNEEESCEDLSLKLGEKAGIACTAMVTFSDLLSKLSSHREQLQKSSNRTVQRVIRTLSYGALIVCLEHEQSCRWTSAQSVECGKNLLATVCAANGCDTFNLLLNLNDGKFSLLRQVLNELLPKLTRTTWKLNPASSHVFRRCLLGTQQPLLSDCLPMFLPPTLLFVDDFETENRLSGLHCLSHIMQHCSKTELRWYGRADVIYDSLLRAMFGCDNVVLEAVILCLFDVLDIVEVSPQRATGQRSWCRHDDVFVKYLTNMEMESRVPLRRVYAKHLGLFVSKLGIVVVRHLSQLLRVVADYVQVSDGPDEQCRCDVLEALSVLLLETWPRVPYHADDIMKSLVRLLVDVRRQTDIMSTSTQDRLQHRALDCVHLLRKICPEYLELTDEFFSQITDN